MYSYMLTWLTPSPLFLLLNLTIATIVISHRFNKPDQHLPENPTGIVRTRSLLERVRSFNYTTFQQEQHVTHQDTSSHESPSGIVRTPSLLERVMSFQRGEEYVTHVTEVDTSAPEKPTGIVRTRSLLERVRSFNYTTFQQEQHVTHQDTSSHENPSGIVRTPSLLERVMSFQRGEEEVTHVTEVDTSAPEKPTGIVRTPSMLARLNSMDFSSLYRDVHHVVVHRSKSEKKGEEEGPWPEKVMMKKTASERGLVEENVDEGNDRHERRVVMERTMSFGDDEEVDAKADDFINRFKQQLKLQRLDSLLRYKYNNYNA